MPSPGRGRASPWSSSGPIFFAVYAPIQDDSERSAFNADFFEFVTSVDMQVPILFMGDFNGTVSPYRDYSNGVGPVCGLLTFRAPADRCLTCSSLRHLNSGFHIPARTS